MTQKWQRPFPEKIKLKQKQQTKNKLINKIPKSAAEAFGTVGAGSVAERIRRRSCPGPGTPGRAAAAGFGSALAYGDGRSGTTLTV